jgi:hypothetical protein
MKKNRNPLDDFFRESLDDFRLKPSEESRETFLREAGEIMEKTPSGRTVFYISLSILLLVLTIGGAGIYFLTGTKSAPSSINSDQRTLTASNKPLQNESYQKLSPVPDTKAEISHTAKNLTAISGSVLIKNESLVENIKSQPPIPAGVAESNALFKTDTAKTDLESRQGSAGNHPATQTDTSIIKQDTTVLPARNEKGKPAQSKSIYFSAGIQYTPEWMFNLVNDETKFCNNFGLEASFYFERFSVRTGLGLSITKGSTETAIGTEEYLGAINALDSITFSWNSQTYQYIPEIYTTPKNVYDTLVKFTYTNVEKRYTYLQVPMILGYDFLVKDKIRFGVRVGPVISFLLNTKQLTATFDPGKDKLIQINNITPDRISTNWQIVGGISLSVLLNKKLTLELEPEARYYFNSVYEKSDITKKPWSVGIRAALYLNFIK